MKNAKAKYETLFNMNLKDTVMYNDLNSRILEKALIEVKRNQNNLFLAAEQGLENLNMI